MASETSKTEGPITVEVIDSTTVTRVTEEIHTVPNKQQEQNSSATQPILAGFRDILNCPVTVTTQSNGRFNGLISVVDNANGTISLRDAEMIPADSRNPATKYEKIEFDILLIKDIRLRSDNPLMPNSSPKSSSGHTGSAEIEVIPLDSTSTPTTNSSRQNRSNDSMSKHIRFDNLPTRSKDPAVKKFGKRVVNKRDSDFNGHPFYDNGNAFGRRGSSYYQGNRRYMNNNRYNGQQNAGYRYNGSPRSSNIGGGFLASNLETHISDNSTRFFAPSRMLYRNSSVGGGFLDSRSYEKPIFSSHNGNFASGTGIPMEYNRNPNYRRGLSPSHIPSSVVNRGTGGFNDDSSSPNGDRDRRVRRRATEDFAGSRQSKPASNQFFDVEFGGRRNSRGKQDYYPQHRREQNMHYIPSEANMARSMTLNAMRGVGGFYDAPPPQQPVNVRRSHSFRTPQINDRRQAEYYYNRYDDTFRPVFYPGYWRDRGVYHASNAGTGGDMYGARRRTSDQYNNGMRRRSSRAREIGRQRKADFDFEKANEQFKKCTEKEHTQSHEESLAESKNGAHSANDHTHEEEHAYPALARLDGFFDDFQHQDQEKADERWLSRQVNLQTFGRVNGAPLGAQVGNRLMRRRSMPPKMFGYRNGARMNLVSVEN